MPDETQTDTDLKEVLDHIEDKTINNYKSRIDNYEVVKHVLSQNKHIPIPVIERILMVCVHDMKEDLKYTAVSLGVILAVLNKLKREEYTPLPDLAPSALAVINIIKTIGLIRKVDILRGLCFDIFLKYPTEVLINIATNHCSEVFEIFDLYCHQRVPLDIKIQTCNIIAKFLKILPSPIRTQFVKDGMSVWFYNILPAILMYLTTETQDNLKVLEVLELLTEELVNIDYTSNPQWKSVLESICNPAKYPLCMKSLLESGSNYWHRIWIVFIKLLNTQITRNSSAVGTPINSMLPVVELAFKMDPANRCRAFQCWNVLIDNFSNETNENCIAKRVKLLIIPLKLNNAKVEEIALAKFDSWWHLIRKFQPRLDKFVDTIIIPFLHFCFGKHSASAKPGFVAGQISDHMKNQCLKGLVDIAGHVNCDGCTDLPKLNGKLIRVKYLVDFWNDWTHSLKTVIKTAANEASEITKQQVRCLWKSFILTIFELPANNIRKDLFIELLTMLTHLVQDCDDKLANIVFNDMILPLYDEEIKNKKLFDMKSEEHPLYSVLNVMVHPSLNSVYVRSNAVELITKLKKITDFIVQESNHMEWLLKNLPINDNTLKLWTALAESICEAKSDICPNILYNVLIWPLKSMNQFKDAICSALPWHTMYNLIHLKIKTKCDIDKDILKCLVVNNEYNHSIICLTICVVLAVLKRTLVMEHCVKLEPELLENFISRVGDYQHIEKIFPLLVDTLVVMLNNATATVNVTLAKHTVTCVKKVLSLTNPVLKQESNRNDVAHLLILMENLLKPVEELFKIDSYSDLKTMVVDELIECGSLFSKPTAIVNNILSIMKTFLSDSNEIHIKVSSAINVIENENKSICTSVDKQDISDKEFTTPISKEIPKKVKKKEPSIINKVVENGEEYVVVKSNWKFNPRKLTENQKEKLQRKREDIPALYQDLSQSQDEFKLVTWNSDSQDTLSTNSKSSKSANEDASVILQNLPSSNVVPTIIENILAENVNNQSSDTEKNSVPKDKLPTLLNTKSPRMALKDRVFRNVRNLLEKSTTQKDGNTMAQDQIENALRTPPSKTQNTISLRNSAPPLISSERPSRVKRKPKKFDDTELFALKKSRHTLNDFPVDIEIANKINVALNKEGENYIHTENTSANSIINNNVNQTKHVPVDKSEFFEPSVEPTSENVKIVQTTLEGSLNLDKFNENDTKEKVAIKENANLLVPEESTKVQEKLVDKNDAITNISTNDCKEPSTPKLISKSKEIDEQKSSVKKSSTKKSRIEKELAIDMVEGHPFLKILSEQRLTRKKLTSPANSVRRKTLSEKFYKTKSETKNKSQKSKDKLLVNIKEISFRESETQEKNTNSFEDLPLFDDPPCSEDIIESSQDSSLTTINVKSLKKIPKKFPVITLERIKDIPKEDEMITKTQSLLQDLDSEMIELPNTESKDDTELSRNKTAADDENEVDLTENMDTQPIEKNISLSAYVIVVNSDVEAPIAISGEETFVGKDTQEMVEANTRPTDPGDFIQTEITESSLVNKTDNLINLQSTCMGNESQDALSIMDKSTLVDAQEVGLKTIAKPIVLNTENNADASSPYKDDTQRQQDFLNNTLQISPIKIQSPERQNKTPSPETSSDYVVIKLSSPVHSNGEPFEKCGSPEFFTEDKISPDKRDQSPPREEITINNTSPSSSLSLKKNRPQVRSGGRAAHMLGLCVPEKLHTIINSDRAEGEEVKKCSPSSTPARRNLKIFYNSVSDNAGNVSDNEDSENFLKLKKSLPAADSSPSGPILKRKLAEIADDIMSPASKRKRVSFHDPPVSTTISVQKYIEPTGIRSPQSSTQKRQERQVRLHANMKSPKRLDTVFKLDTVLTRAVESFTEVDITIADDTQSSSLEQTPAVEIIKTSDLNDTDPICVELLDCMDPIDNIASDLSSPAMKELFIKELEGKVETVGDLAKMTEIDVNRLCIKAPKVKVAKKVLMDYFSKKTVIRDATILAEEAKSDEPVTAPKNKVISVEVEVQTGEVLTNNMEVQTISEPLMISSTQTESLSISHTYIQTEESGSKSTADLISSCLTERQDFIDQLSENLEESRICQIAEKLSLESMIDSLMKKSDNSTSSLVLNRILEKQSTHNSSNTQTDNKELSFLRDYLCDRFESRDLILFCSQLLQKVHDKSA